MNKRLVLEIIIAALLLLVGYLIYDGTTKESESTIRISEPVITDTPPAEPNNETEVIQTETVLENESDESVRFTGVLMGFADGKDEYLGSFKYALIDDGTEIIRVDLRSVVGYDVTNLESDLGVQTGERVEVAGYLENGEFVATLMKAE